MSERADEVVESISAELPDDFGLPQAMSAVRAAYMVGYQDALLDGDTERIRELLEQAKR